MKKLIKKKGNITIETFKKLQKKVIFSKTRDKDFIESLIEENPDIPNLKKYL